MSKVKRRIICFIAVVVFLLGVVFVPYPVSIDARDDDEAKRHAVDYALRALFHDSRVLTDRGYIQLYESDAVHAGKTIYFGNELGISNEVFHKYGLKQLPEDANPSKIIRSGDVIVWFSFESSNSLDDTYGKELKDIDFSYVYGTMAAQGWRIEIYKGIFLRYYRFIHLWVS